MRTTVETHLMKFCIVGDIFYTCKSDRHMRALAHQHGKKVRTERVVAVSQVNWGKKDATIEFITKVEIVTP
jgi:hypothetical protein